MASSINASTSGAGGLITTADNTGILNIQTAGTTALTVDASQNATFAGKVASAGALTLASNGTTTAVTVDTSQNVLIGQTTNAQGGRLVIKGSAGTADDLVVNTNATYCELQSFNTKPLVFNRQGNNVCFGGTTSIENTVYNFTFDSAYNGIGSKTNTSGTSYHVRWHNTNGVVGGIYTNGSNTTYTTSSDYRLKENITPMTGALDKVLLLKPVTYTWKSDGSNGQGFIAHELQAIVPECVGGEKDAVNDDGSINPQGVDTSFLVATLTAAIQEQQTIINDLKARVTALEAK
jgi:hypothetical protein